MSFKPSVPGVEILNPFYREESRKSSEEFYHKFYRDKKPRILLLGINPGRKGAGVTGVGFTDPVNLLKYGGIASPFEQSSELSSQFIYEVIQEFGGIESFTHHFFISSVSPLGFIKDGKNLNYYDMKSLQNQCTPFIVKSIEEQLGFPSITDKCVCIGEGKNMTFLSELNNKKKWFKEIISLPHPRYILQYKRAEKQKYVDQYLKVLKRSIGE